MGGFCIFYKNWYTDFRLIDVVILMLINTIEDYVLENYNMGQLYYKVVCRLMEIRTLYNEYILNGNIVYIIELIED